MNDVLAKRDFSFFFRFFFFFVSEMVAKLRIEVELNMVNSRDNEQIKKSGNYDVALVERKMMRYFFLFFFSWNRMPSFRRLITNRGKRH